MSSDSGDESWGYDREDDPADASTDPLHRGFGSGYSVRPIRNVDDPVVLEDDGEIDLHHPDHNYGEDDDFEEEEWDEELDPLGPEDEVCDEPWLIGRDHEIGWPFDQVDVTRLTRHLRVDDADRVRGWLVRLDQVEDFSEIEPSRLVRYWNLLFEFYEARVRVSEAIGSSIYEAAVRWFLGDLAHAIDLLSDTLDESETEPSTAFRDQLLRNGHAPSGVWVARLLVDRFRRTWRIRFGSDWPDEAAADHVYEVSLREIRDEADELARRSTSSHAHRLLLAASVGCSSSLYERERVLAAESLYRSLVEQSWAEEKAPVEGPELEVISEAVLQEIIDTADERRFVESAMRFMGWAGTYDDRHAVQLVIAGLLRSADLSRAGALALSALDHVVDSYGEGSEEAFHAALMVHEAAARGESAGFIEDLERTWIPRALAAPPGWASQKWAEIGASRL